MKKSQRVIHAVMKNRNIHAYQLQRAGYLYSGISIKQKDRILEIVNRVQLYRIHCNLLKIMNSLTPLCGFSQIGFSRKNLLSLLGLCV